MADVGWRMLDGGCWMADGNPPFPSWWGPHNLGLCLLEVEIDLVMLPCFGLRNVSDLLPIFFR